MEENDLPDFDALIRDEQQAFLAWFAGGNSFLTKYGNRKDVFFGKAECEWVDFDDFWQEPFGLSFFVDRHMVEI